MNWNDTLKIYDAIVAQHPDIQRKGKTVPYTSANGYMFSLVNKEGQLGFRLPKEVQENFKKEYNSTIFKSHGAVMKDYVLIPENLFEETELLLDLLDQAYQFVCSLPPK